MNIEIDLMCNRCGSNVSEFLVFFEKFHAEIGKRSFIDPEIICPGCKDEIYPKGALFDNRPIIYHFTFFASTGKQADSKKQAVIGWLTSKKGKEHNALNNPFWRKKLWRIRAIAQGKLEKQTIEMERANEASIIS